ncbi:uncharacterized protein LOC142509323 [Primulina tabacum]|uniref:uncharacterized protein LOC142509323 n=1 Tax=Primulina tabacum TaxID=48773 RepID=UPI003F595818
MEIYEIDWYLAIFFEAYCYLINNAGYHRRLGLRGVTEFTYNNSYQSSIGMASSEALYGRKCRSHIYWDEVGGRGEFGPDLIKQTTELVVKIRERMKTIKSQQKSYANKLQRELEFAVGDHVFVKVAPMKGVTRFGKRGKLSSRFIVLFEILEKIGKLAYRVALPPMLAGVHNVFHISILWKYMSKFSHALNYEPLPLIPNILYKERPKQIL